MTTMSTTVRRPNPDAKRSDYYQMPRFSDPRIEMKLRAFVNVVMRFGLGVAFGIFLYCAMGAIWYIVTQLIGPVHDAMHAHISSLYQHGIRDGDFEKFIALTGVAAVFAKPPKEITDETNIPWPYQFLNFLRIPNKFQGRPMSGWQFLFLVPALYLVASPGLTLGTVFYANVSNWWRSSLAAMHATNSVNHFTAHVLSLPFIGFLWLHVIAAAPKYLPAFLGVALFGFVVSGYAAWNVQAVFLETLVAKKPGIKLPFIVPAIIRDHVGDIQYKRELTGTEVNEHGHLYVWSMAGVWSLTLLAGAGGVIIYILAKFYQVKSGGLP